MLRLAAERDELKVVADQVGAPTGADLIADVTTLALRHAFADPSACGLYHLTSAGETSWFDYARYVIEWARNAGFPIRVIPTAVRAVPSSAYPTAARRPLNSRLSTDRLRDRFALNLPPWQVGVERMLTEIQ
jgi:dTDP-4-dehydrorhamnose reductase